MKSKNILEMSKKRIFRTTYNDFSTMVAQETLTIGLARLLSLQIHLDYDPDAIMVCFPGTTPTGGKDRLQRGYSLGMVLRYNYSPINITKEPLVILDPKTNCCGVLAASFDGDPPIKKKVIKKIKGLVRRDSEIEGIKILMDKYFVGNHFINFYKGGLFTERIKSWIVIHGSGEVRKDNNLGMGIYVDESEELKNIARRYDTPLGPVYYLLGEEAMFFLKQHQRAEEISVRSREYIAKALVKNAKILSNFSHLTIVNPGIYFCGVYNTRPGVVYPFLISEKDGVALMQARENFTPEAIDCFGWKKQAQELGVYSLLQSINGLPHGGRKIYGGGRYKLIGTKFEQGKIVYSISDGQNKFQVTNLKSLNPINYRGDDELTDIQKMGMADNLGKLYFGEKGFTLNITNWS